MSKLYITTMHRYDSNKGHNYVLGAYKSPSQAATAGEAEAQDRGGKYESRVTPVLLGTTHKNQEPRRHRSANHHYRPTFMQRLALKRWINFYEGGLFDRLGDEL